MVKTIVLDYGGVFAEEGFREGLHVIADRYRLSKKSFFEIASRAVYDTGYITGKGTENAFWQALFKQSGLNSAVEEDLRQEILSRFTPRPWMIRAVRVLRLKGYRVVILSDQSDWLDLLNEQHDFFKEFDAIFNSYHLGKSKRDPSIFDDIVKTLNIAACETLFVDDNPEHINRAAANGLMTHLYITRSAFEAEIVRYGITI